MGIGRSKSYINVTSDITCGHHTVLNAWTIKINGKLPQRNDIQRYAEELV